MKNIDPKAITVRKVLCPFCSFGCDFGVVLYDFGIKGVEYDKAGSTGGRLCPRGSAAAMYLDHPRRLSMPTKKGKAVDWSRMGKELRKIAGSPKNVAVTVDRNVTPEEYSKILGFCKQVGIEDIASTYFEPEYYLKKFLSRLSIGS
jgi:anaerobic selenocysteine-containing dehydrogenase